MPSPPAREQGSYFDGITGARQAVSLALEPSAIVIATTGGATLARWDYADIEDLPAPDGRTRLGLATGSSTARLEVHDGAVASAIRTHLGIGSPQRELAERRARRRVIQWTVAALVAIVVVGVSGMPAVTQFLLPLIPYSTEARMGLEAHLEEKRGYDERMASYECGDAGPEEKAGKAVFLAMFRRLEAAADLPIPLHAYVIRSDEIDASALPGGYIHISKGMIDALQSPDELGGIVGHEIGHVAHRDSVWSALNNAGLAFLFGMALGDVIRSSGVILAAYKVVDSRHGRRQESAADAFGVQLMNKLGADSHAVIHMFERLMQRYMQESTEKPPERRRPLLLFESHPADASRIAAIGAMPAVADPRSLLSVQDWQTLKRVCSGR